ncbi:NUDIX hydrolase, partial [Verrucomicrobiota bacterium]
IMNEKTISSKTIFDGRLLKLELLDVELENGIRSSREIVRHKGAVAILAQLPDERFVFVRQFRKAIEKDLLEIVAGTLESGENPVDCAKREMKEETGFTCDELKKLGVVYLTPGYSSEQTHLFYAGLLPEAKKATPEDDENLDVVYVTAEQLEEMISGGKIEDAKTLAAWMLYQKTRNDE